MFDDFFCITWSIRYASQIDFRLDKLRAQELILLLELNFFYNETCMSEIVKNFVHVLPIMFNYSSALAIHLF